MFGFCSIFSYNKLVFSFCFFFVAFFFLLNLLSWICTRIPRKFMCCLFFSFFFSKKCFGEKVFRNQCSIHSTRNWKVNEFWREEIKNGNFPSVFFSFPFFDSKTNQSNNSTDPQTKNRKCFSFLLIEWATQNGVYIRIWFRVEINIKPRTLKKHLVHGSFIMTSGTEYM